MAEPKIRVVFLWHMHQPYYKDLVQGRYRLPWTRLHALKDYFGMVAILEEFPGIRQTFNLVPSLLTQLEDYEQGTALETMQEIAYKPTEELTREDTLYMLRYFFQANLDHLIGRYPRYRRLYDRMQANDFQPEKALPFFQQNDLRDLQVLSQLAWMDEQFLAEDPELGALVEKGRGYEAGDQQLLQKKQAEVIRTVFQQYRTASEQGRIEISTSPFYHPILPLLCDTDVAAQAHPGASLPRRFRHPEDARLQLERAVALHQRLFGRAPRGLWPSEGSVSEEVLQIAASCGFEWVATDQRVLGNSIGAAFYRNESGEMVNGERLYRPYVVSTEAGPVQMLFRDQDLSDRIGFAYSHMEAEHAAIDFVQRLKQCVGPMLRQGKSALVSVILDGENAWEYFLQSGRPFLRALYGRLSEAPQVECVTVSEALQQFAPSEPLGRLAPGSWINGNFDIWIGAEEDNRSWDLLSNARDFYAEHAPSAVPAQRELALEELLIAEGSDWNWWYGPEHSTANDVDFDDLYRSHLSNVYKALGHAPPEELWHPIMRLQSQAVSRPPEGPLSPQIDGAVTNYFEWMGAGLYRPVHRDGAMHGKRGVISQIIFGRDAQHLYLRADFHDLAQEDPERIEVHVLLREGGVPTVMVRFRRVDPQKGWLCDILTEKGTPVALGEAALRKIFEVRLNLSAMGLRQDQPLEFQFSLWEDNLPVETLPLDGWLVIPVGP